MKFIGFICKLLIKIMTIVMIASLILVGVSLFVTPATFGLENMEINGVSIEDQGLANTSFYNIGKIAMGILIVHHEQPVPEESYTTVVDKLPEISAPKAPSVSEGEDKEDIQTDSVKQALPNLLTSKVYFEEEVEIKLESTEIAALMNMVVVGDPLEDILSYNAMPQMTTYIANIDNQQLQKLNMADTVDNAEEYFDISDNEFIEFMKAFNCEFLSIQPKHDAGVIDFDTKVKLALPSDVIDMVNELGVIKITEHVYLSFLSEGVINNGELIAHPVDKSTMQFNNLSVADTMKTATIMMGIAYGEAVDGEEIMTDYNDTASKMLMTVLNNLGEVQGVTEDGNIIIKTRTK